MSSVRSPEQKSSECDISTCSCETEIEIYLEGRFSSNVRDKKVHGYVFTVDKFVHCISDCLGQPLTVQIEVVLGGRGR